jgi:hypothetical protein
MASRTPRSRSVSSTGAMPGKSGIRSAASAARRRIWRAINGSFHIGTPSSRMIWRLLLPRISSISCVLNVRKAKRTATSLNTLVTQARLSASVPSKSKITSR